MYLLVKQAHISFAIASIALFVLRANWSIRGSASLQQTWVKVVPHTNDSLLLACAVYLAVASQQYPLQQAWLSAKVLALLAYIVFGSYAIKYGRTKKSRLSFALVAILLFFYMLAVAFTKRPWLFA